MADPNILGDQVPEEVEQLFADEPEPTPEETQPGPETPSEPQAEAPVEQAPTQEQPAAEEAEAPTAEEGTPPAEEPKMWAGKYDAPEKLEAAYENAQQFNTRLAQEKATLQAEYQRLMDEQQKAAPLIKQLIEERRQAQQQQGPPPDFDPMDPAQVDAYINTRIQQGLEAQMGPLQQAQQQAAEQARTEMELHAKRQEFQSWQAENPDFVVAPGNENYNALNSVITEFQRDESGQLKEELFPPTRQHLTVARKVAEDPQLFAMTRRLQFVPSDDADLALLRDALETPALASHLEANPIYLESAVGHTIARQLAGMPQAVTQAQTNANQAQQQAAEQQRRAAHVESDSSGTPASSAPGQRPDDTDAWEAIGGPLWDSERSILNR